LKSLWLGGVLALVLGGLAVTLQGPTQTIEAADIHELERLETVWNVAHERGDADALDACGQTTSKSLYHTCR